jgi:hypothetical protein
MSDDTKVTNEAKVEAEVTNNDDTIYVMDVVVEKAKIVGEFVAKPINAATAVAKENLAAKGGFRKANVDQFHSDLAAVQAFFARFKKAKKVVETTDETAPQPSV